MAKTAEKYLTLYAIKYASAFIGSNETDALSYETLLLKNAKTIEISEKFSLNSTSKNAGGQIWSARLKEGKKNTFYIWVDSTTSLKTIAIILLHEINHATALLNSTIIKNQKTKKPYKYEGFSKKHIFSEEKEGIGLNEFVNDFITYMQFFHYYRKHFKSLKYATADTIFDFNQKYWPIVEDRKSYYKKAMSIPRLLGVACENKPNVSYEDLLNNGISPVTGLVKGRNGETKYINDMIYASKFTSLDLKSNINRLTKNPRSYDKLIKNSDYILEKIETNNFNKNNLSDECRNVLIETFDIIKNYHEKKAEYNYLTGFWNEQDFQKSHERFNYVYNDVLKEFNLTNNKEPKRMVK